MTGIYQSNYVFAAANCPQFANEINLKEFENKSLCYFYKKTTEHKCYKEEVNKRNILCYANTDNWSCKSGYRKSGEKCFKNAVTQQIPRNAHKVGTSWVCNTNYYRNNAKTGCLYVPANASSSYSSNIFKCNTGYSKSGNRCVRNSNTIKIPQNSHKVGTSWVCNTNYYRNNAKTGCLYVPANSTSSYSSNDFKCNTGFSKSGNSCVKIITIPQNSHKVGTSWVCNTNYYRNNAKTGCLYVPANSTSSYSSNDFKCNGGYQKKNSYSCISDIEVFKNWVFKNWIYIAIAIFILWLFTRKGDKKPKPPPQESPSHRAQPKPSPRPKPKPRRRKVKDPQTLLIEIGVAVAMADGNLSDIEGITINKWMKKMLDFHGNNEKLKKLFNDTLRDAISSAKTSSHDLRAICLQLNSQGTNKLKLDALTMAYEVMGADGHIHEKEAEMIHSIVTTLEIHSINQENIRDQFIIKTLIESDFNFINLLGMSISASKESKCKKLKEEFRKWNGRMNSLPSSKERKNVQKVLDLIGKARKDNNC